MENNELPQSEESVSTPAVLDENRIFQYREKKKLEQNLPKAVIGGLLAALLGSIIWAVITVATGYQIGYMAVGVGFLVGFSVRYMGDGIDQIFGITGALFALLGCLGGNFLSLIGFAANSEGLGYFETLLSVDYSVVPQVMIEAFSPMDILFYGLALYEGYKFSFRQFTDSEMMEDLNTTK